MGLAVVLLTATLMAPAQDPPAPAVGAPVVVVKALRVVGAVLSVVGGGGLMTASGAAALTVVCAGVGLYQSRQPGPETAVEHQQRERRVQWANIGAGVAMVGGGVVGAVASVLLAVGLGLLFSALLA